MRKINIENPISTYFYYANKYNDEVMFSEYYGKYIALDSNAVLIANCLLPYEYVEFHMHGIYAVIVDNFESACNKLGRSGYADVGLIKGQVWDGITERKPTKTAEFSF